MFLVNYVTAHPIFKPILTTYCTKSSHRQQPARDVVHSSFTASRQELRTVEFLGKLVFASCHLVVAKIERTGGLALKRDW